MAATSSSITATCAPPAFMRRTLYAGPTPGAPTSPDMARAPAARPAPAGSPTPGDHFDSLASSTMTG